MGGPYGRREQGRSQEARNRIGSKDRICVQSVWFPGPLIPPDEEPPMRPWQWLLRWPTLVLLGGAALVTAPLPAAEKTAATRDLESEARLRRDVTFLASDACEGR